MSEVVVTVADVRTAKICQRGIHTFAKRYPQFSIVKLIKEGYTESELLAISQDEPILRIIEIAKARGA